MLTYGNYQPQKIPYSLRMPGDDFILGNTYPNSSMGLDLPSSSVGSYRPAENQSLISSPSSMGNLRLADSAQTQSNIAQAESMANMGGDALGAAGSIPSPASPYLMGGSLALKGFGTAADLYGKYQERNEAKKRFQDTVKAWETSEAERKADKAREEARRSRQEGYYASDFSQGLEDRLASTYGGYRTPLTR